MSQIAAGVHQACLCKVAAVPVSCPARTGGRHGLPALLPEVDTAVVALPDWWSSRAEQAFSARRGDCSEDDMLYLLMI